jgi:hypothetical protein
MVLVEVVSNVLRPIAAIRVGSQAVRPPPFLQVEEITQRIAARAVIFPATKFATATKFAAATKFAGAKASRAQAHSGLRLRATGETEPAAQRWTQGIPVPCGRSRKLGGKSTAFKSEATAVKPVRLKALGVKAFWPKAFRSETLGMKSLGVKTAGAKATTVKAATMKSANSVKTASMEPASVEAHTQRFSTQHDTEKPRPPCRSP